MDGAKDNSGELRNDGRKTDGMDLTDPASSTPPGLGDADEEGRKKMA